MAAIGTNFCHQRGGEPWSEWFMSGWTRCLLYGWASMGTPMSGRSAQTDTDGPGVAASAPAVLDYYEEETDDAAGRRGK